MVSFCSRGVSRPAWCRPAAVGVLAVLTSNKVSVCQWHIAAVSNRNFYARFWCQADCLSGLQVRGKEIRVRVVWAGNERWQQTCRVVEETLGLNYNRVPESSHQHPPSHSPSCFTERRISGWPTLRATMRITDDWSLIFDDLMVPPPPAGQTCTEEVWASGRSSLLLGFPAADAAVGGLLS